MIVLSAVMTKVLEAARGYFVRALHSGWRPITRKNIEQMCLAEIFSGAYALSF